MLTIWQEEEASIRCLFLTPYQYRITLLLTLIVSVMAACIAEYAQSGAGSSRVFSRRVDGG